MEALDLTNEEIEEVQWCPPVEFRETALPAGNAPPVFETVADDDKFWTQLFHGGYTRNTGTNATVEKPKWDTMYLAVESKAAVRTLILMSKLHYAKSYYKEQFKDEVLENGFKLERGVTYMAFSFDESKKTSL